jgi:lysozyme
MKASEEGLELIKAAEGLRLKAYVCPGGELTIGYGHTKGVKKGQICTPADADKWLRDDVKFAEQAVNRHVKVALKQGQFDALVSFVFNLGPAALGGSTLLRYLNKAEYDKAASEFCNWVYAKGKRLPGLVSRRAAEEALFRR